jgi:hypothetical protein
MAKSRRSLSGEQATRQLLAEESPELLADLQILTRDGRMNADSLRKLKQVNHLVTLLAPAAEDLLARVEEPVVVDCGAGKGVLGFVLASVFFRQRGRVISVESRADLCAAGAKRAARLGFTRMEFVHASVEGAALPARIDLVTALHACDTATDDALALALAHDTAHVAVVPCCQAEVARQLKQAPRDTAMAALWAHPMHRREFGAQLTNVIRALALESRGYAVTVTELTGWEHSLKNELILGRKVQPQNPPAARRLRALLDATGVRPKLVASALGQ